MNSLGSLFEGQNFAASLVQRVGSLTCQPAKWSGYFPRFCKRDKSKGPQTYLDPIGLARRCRVSLYGSPENPRFCAASGNIEVEAIPVSIQTWQLLSFDLPSVNLHVATNLSHRFSNR